MRDGNAPTMARWLADDTHRLTEWETDLSSQTGASQAGILLGSNEDISAFRWVEKETGTMMTCSAPPDCAEIERRRATGIGLLVDGGSSRGNLLSGEAEDVILTVSRMEAEKKSNPGYRAFLANGDNVTRTLVLFIWEVDPRVDGGGAGDPARRAAARAPRRHLSADARRAVRLRARPDRVRRAHRHDARAARRLRDVLELRRGRAPLGLERADTLEALRKLDTSSRRSSARAATRRGRTRSSSSPTTGRRRARPSSNATGTASTSWSSARSPTATCPGSPAATSRARWSANAFSEATGKQAKRPKNDVSDRDVVVLGSGNLGLVYLMEERRRLTLEEIEERHPQLVPALREHPHVGWLLVRSSEHGAVALGARGAHYLADGRVEGEDPLAPFSPTAPRHLLRTDGFEHVADIMVGSFYDPELDEGCAFEELICFHGGIGGQQTRPFILHPAHLEVPPEPIVGAASVHGILAGWRQPLQRPSRGARVPSNGRAAATGRTTRIGADA